MRGRLNAALKPLHAMSHGTKTIACRARAAVALRDNSSKAVCWPVQLPRRFMFSKRALSTQKHKSAMHAVQHDCFPEAPDVVPCSRSRTLTHPVLNSRVIVHWTCRSDLGPVPRNIAAQCFIPMRSVNKIRLNSKRGIHLPNSTLKGRPLFKVTYQRPMTPIHRYAFPLRTRLLTEVHNPNASNLST